MCGIAAVAREQDRGPLLRALLAGIGHRGEPATARESADLAPLGVALGANRLPIVDPPHGAQPQTSPSGRYRLVFNGEVFNHHELAEELGVPARGDTAALVAAIDRWGIEQAVRRCVWEGAAVCVDTEDRVVWTARDHIGIKPLYRARVDGGVAWASEIKALVPHAAGAIEPIGPGTLVRHRDGEHHITTWWRPEDHTGRATVDPAEAVERVAELVDAAVRVRVPDGRYAVALSGGVDSSLVLALARRVNHQVTAYTLAAPGSPDLPYARELCRLLDVRLVEVPAAAPLQLCDSLPSVVRSVESWEWHVVNHAGPMTALFSAIRADGHRVTLTGEGADELFLGYTPAGALVDTAALAAERLARVRQLHRTNCRRLDRMAMAETIECRVPLLDRALTEYALGLDPTLARRDGLNKWVLRQAALHTVPARFALRTKLSFARGAGFDYGRHAQSSVYGRLPYRADALPEPWSSLARYPVERVFLHHFLDNGYDKADYLRSRSV